MKKKNLFSIFLVIFLLFLNIFPAFAIEGDRTSEDNGHIEKQAEDECITASALQLNIKEGHIPDVPPDFTVKIEQTGQGYLLKGKVTEFLPSTVEVRPQYSLDGDNYKVICEEQPYDWQLDKLGSEDEDELKNIYSQTCAEPSVEPLKSYLNAEIDSFYTRLKITLDDGRYYYTKPFQLVRGDPQVLPSDANVSAIFPKSMRVVDTSERPFYTYGKYQITVRENSSLEDIYNVLPDTVPVEIQIVLADGEDTPIIGYVETPVMWNEMVDIELVSGQTITIADAAADLKIPVGTKIHTPLGIYILSSDLQFDGVYARDEIRLVINTIAVDEGAIVSLRGSLIEDNTENQLPLSLAFSLKPSGADSIKAYCFEDGDDDWTELCDLLTFREIDANQSERLYGYVNVLQPTESHYKQYLKGEITGFLIGLVISGGVYDGETVMLKWPGEYDPPDRIPDIGGSGGNQNNAGSGGNHGSSGSSNNGGQRPDLPKDEEQNVTTPSLEKTDNMENILSDDEDNTAQKLETEQKELVDTETSTKPIIEMESSEHVDSGKNQLLVTQSKEPDDEAGEEPANEVFNKLDNSNTSETMTEAEVTERTQPSKDGLSKKVLALLLAGGVMATIGVVVVGTSVATSTGMVSRLINGLKQILKKN